MPSSRLRAALALFGRASAAAAGRRQYQQQHAPALAAALAAATPPHAVPPVPPPTATTTTTTAPLLPPFRRPFASEAAPSAASSSSTKEDYSHLPGYTLADVAKRDGLSGGETNGENGRAAAWLAIDGLVYDATPYLDEHPGGADPIILNAGTDASAEFAAVHTQAAREVLRRFVIGRLVEEPEEEGGAAAAGVAAAEAAASSSSSSSAVALDPKRRVPMPLVSRRWVSPTSVLLRFALPGGKEQRAGLPTGQHVMVYCREQPPPSPEDGGAARRGGAGGGGAEGELVARAYTPVSRDEDAGTLDLLVRVYRPNARFPKGGRLSQLLADSVPVEEEAGQAASSSSSASSSSFPRVEFKGPVGHFRYLTGQGGQFSLANAPARRASRLLLVAGGSGITPCYQVIRAVLEEREKGIAGAPTVSLVYGSPCPEEILLKTELDDLARRFPPPAFSLHYTVDRVPGGEDAEAQWRAGGGGVGFVTRDTLERHGFAGVAEDAKEEGGERLALVCGPPVMLEQAVVPALKAMGFEGDRLVAF